MLPSWPAASAAAAIAAAPGTATLTGNLQGLRRCRWAEGRGDRSRRGCCSAASLGSGVKVIVSVVVCPTASVGIGARPVSVRPEGSVSVRAMLFSVTLPTFVIVSMSVTGLPGIVLRPSGLR